MPYGAKRSQKGRARKFTSAEELEAQRGEDGSWRKKKDESSEESSSEEEDGNDKDAPIEVHNPNRVAQKTKKVSELDDISKVKPADLSRREKEEIAKAESQRRYQQLHAQGKTDEARADLARLAIIRKQREEAAEKRKQEKLEEEERKKASKEASLNAIKSKGGSGGRRKR